MSEGFSVRSAKPLEPPKSSRNVQERKEWSFEEDAIILARVTHFGCRWRRIAAELTGRSDDAVRNRWKRLRDGFPDNPPAPVQKSHRRAAVLGETQSAFQSNHTNYYTSQKGATSAMVTGTRATGIRVRPERPSWTRTEDAIIVRSVADLGHQWHRIASRFPGRTSHAIRNRFHRLQAIADDMQMTNERNGINALEEHRATSAHRVHMPPTNPMQSIQPIQSIRDQMHESTFLPVSTLSREQQRQQLLREQRELQRRQLELKEQERKLIQQHRQQQDMYRQQVRRGQMPPE